MAYWNDGIMGDARTEVRDQNHRERKNKKVRRSECEKVSGSRWSVVGGQAPEDGGRKTELKIPRAPELQRPENLEIGYSLLDIGPSYISEYPIINIQCPIIKYYSFGMQYEKCRF